MTTRVAIRGTGIARRTKTEAGPRIRTERGRREAEKTRLQYHFKECIKISASNTKSSLIDYISHLQWYHRLAKKIFHDWH